MLQLILDGIELPETQEGAYTAVRTPLSVDVEMVSGRLVREMRGYVWEITYQYGFFDNEMKNKIIAACEKGRKQAITCGFLTPESTQALIYSDFLITKLNYPQFMWSRNGTPLWADFSFELREVKPHD